MDLSAGQGSSFSGSGTILESSNTSRLVFDYNFTVLNQTVPVIDSLVQTVPTITGSFSFQCPPFPHAVHGVRNVCSGSSQISSSVAVCSSYKDFRSVIKECDLIGLRSQDFKALVRRIWSSSFMGKPPQVVINKLKRLKNALKTWNWEVFGDLNSNITRKSAELQSIQLQMSNLDFSEDLFLAESHVHHELNVLLRRQECFYRDRSRVKWLKDGDRNSSFFHASVRLETEFSLVEDVIPSLVTDVENAFLISIPSTNDIHDAVFAMDEAFAPGPDGFSGRWWVVTWFL
ncbi:hypothetical protein Dsin_009141 [Dipteronia sinensis]|uniref:Reverse transcriptase n=1 Tax=Dipteronia sinensis TaxID=43782 RepID=A0AAE0APZ7_9ROSI|nr:hypothetical protein Dsin_009141 [Dipteronia sinensis]